MPCWHKANINDFFLNKLAYDDYDIEIFISFLACVVSNNVMEFDKVFFVNAKSKVIK